MDAPSHHLRSGKSEPALRRVPLMREHTYPLEASSPMSPGYDFLLSTRRPSVVLEAQFEVSVKEATVFNIHQTVVM